MFETVDIEVGATASTKRSVDDIIAFDYFAYGRMGK